MTTNKISLAWRWVLINALGVAVYLFLESWIIAPRPEGEALNGFDQIFFWLTRMLPVIIAIGVIDVIWATRMARSNSPLRKWQFCCWSLVCLGWCAALLYNGLVVKVVKFVIAAIDANARK